jgi:predicted DsbA family dithiol-disulfide isomerase
VGIEKLKSRYDLEVRWRAFPLHPETPEEGLTLEELFAGRNVHVPAVLARLKKAAGELGLPWGDRTKTYNSRPAQELGKWAEDREKGDEFHNAVFRAYFVEGRNIAKKEVLSDLAGSVGLVKEEAFEILESRSFRAAVDEDWRLSREWGITAVPTFVIQGERLVGAQPYGILEEFVRNHDVPEKRDSVGGA